MAFTLVDTVNGLKGGDFYRPEGLVFPGSSNILLWNLEADETDSRLYAYLYLQIYVPSPIDALATIKTIPLYTQYSLIFSPFPDFTNLNITYAVYAPFGNFQTDIEVYVE